MSDEQDRNWFLRSCDEAATYPANLVYHDTYDYNLRSYINKLDERESLLFCTEKVSILDFWEYDDHLRGEEFLQVKKLQYTDNLVEFQGNCVSSLSDLKLHLDEFSSFSRPDPKCRLA